MAVKDSPLLTPTKSAASNKPKRVGNAEEQEPEEEEEEEDFKLFERNDSYKDKYINTKSPKYQLRADQHAASGGLFDRDDSLYDVMSLGNQTPFKFELGQFEEEENAENLDAQQEEESYRLEDPEREESGAFA